MKNKYIKIVFWGIIGAFIGHCFYMCDFCKTPPSDLEIFKTKYTKEEIEIFNDIAFNNDYNFRWGGRICKWETDLRVQVIGKSDHLPKIEEIIDVLNPLIAPLKIILVEDNANVIVRRGLLEHPRAIGNILGYAQPYINWWDGVIYKWEIIEMDWASRTTLMHEFEHVLGLSHPRKNNSLHFVMVGPDSNVSYHVGEPPPNPEPGHVYFESYEAITDFNTRPVNEMLSKKEKNIIRMLYSPEIKQGLTRREFMKAMGIKDDINIWEKYAKQ